MNVRWVFLAVVAAHGLLHFLGFAKAFRLAELPQLANPISRSAGIAWLAAGVLFLVTAVLFVRAPRIWWMAGFVAVALSQAVIVSAWSDAKLGTIANLVILAGVVYGFASRGPPSFSATYRRDVAVRLIPAVAPTLVTEADLARLPGPVQRYLRVTGSIGQPRVHRFSATWRGRIRSTPDDPWMSFTAEQYNFIDEPARFFLMKARRSGLPVDVYHAFRDDSATMKVRLLSLFPIVNAGGRELTVAETVTLFNDLCLFAPSALIDPAIRWVSSGEDSVIAHYTVGANTISAVLHFNEAGELVDFVSDDRLETSADGRTLTPRRWSTPVEEYRSFGPRRVTSRGEGRWHTPQGDFTYIELELVDLQTFD